MSHVSRFLDEDAHFDEIPGCPLRGVRAGGPLSNDESACARCRYNVAFPKEPSIGCHVRTPHGVVERARAAAGPALVARLAALRAGPFDAAAWSAAGEALIGVDDDDARELGSVIVRFARASALGPVEILR